MYDQAKKNFLYLRNLFVLFFPQNLPYDHEVILNEAINSKELEKYD